MPDDERLQALVLEYFKIDESLYGRDLNLEDLDIDSLTVLEFVVAVEDAFDIELDDEAVSACHTLGEALDLIMEQILKDS